MTGKMLLGILIGLISAVAITALTIAIGCSVNGVSFSQQIVDWFGPATDKVACLTNLTKTAVINPII